MYANYHTHTTRCGHAKGADEEYVLAAIDAGYKILGFSDHSPCLFPDGSQSGYRVQIEEMPGYFASLGALREKYADKIELHIGFEMEYYPLYYKDMVERVKKAGCEYLILGQHAIKNEFPEHIMVAVPQRDDPELLKIYTREVCEALHTGSFTYLCHPEVFNFSGPEEQFLEITRPICVAARETGTPMEINFLGIRDHRYYPMESFWKMAAEEHASVIFGADAHDPGDVYDAASLKIAEGWVKKYGLQLIEKAELRTL